MVMFSGSVVMRCFEEYFVLVAQSNETLHVQPLDSAAV